VALNTINLLEDCRAKMRVKVMITEDIFNISDVTLPSVLLRRSIQVMKVECT